MLSALYEYYDVFEQVCFLLYILCTQVYLRVFLGISHSFCLTSDCKLTVSSENRKKEYQVFPLLNLLDFPNLYLLFINIFIKCYLFQWFMLFLLQYRNTVFVYHFTFYI